jgi:C4-dicarboxylate-specific signal transduction histidine kinase
MQAPQSSTASEWIGYSGQFAALRHITRQMNFKADAPVSVRKPIVVDTTADVVGGVAEGAGLAHDAGNLLGALSLYSDLLGMPGVLHEEHREYAAELRMLSDRSWAMIDRLVNHARGGRRPKAAAASTVVPDVVDRCKGLLSRVAGRTVEISYGAGAFEPVNVPAETVERILTNLVKNAAEATAWVGAISVQVEGATERDEDGGTRRRVVVTVRDRGCGMDASAVRKLMQGGGISPANGRGLGFRVVRELVALSGGCLNIESQLEVGTSIAMEWYAVKELAAGRPRLEVAPRMTERETISVFKGDAGWIAC